MLLAGDALAESRLLPLRCPIQLPVNVRIPQDGLHVLARLSERNRFHKFLGIAIFSLTQPVLHAICARVVSRQRILECSEFVDHPAEVAGTELKIDARRKQWGAGGWEE